MKVGRNDPCACGSGKKYKKCCLQKDEQAAIEARAEQEVRRAAPKAHSLDGEHVTGEIEYSTSRSAAADQCWEAFEDADDETKFTLFRQALEQTDVLDDELAFDMLLDIYCACVERNEIARIVPLLDAFQTRLPEIYEQSALDYLSWHIEVALASANHDSLVALAKAHGERVDRDLDKYEIVRDQLAYHGQLPALLVHADAAYTQIRSDADLWEVHQEEFIVHAQRYRLFEYLERTPAAAANASDLLPILQRYGAVEPNKLEHIVAHLSGQRHGQWTRQDFEGDTTTLQEPDADSVRDYAIEGTASQRLNLLGLEFVAYLHRERGLSYTKADLGNTTLCSYLHQRNSGALSTNDTSMQSPAHKPKQQAKTSTPPHPLCPDPGSLRQYFTEEAGFVMQKQFAFSTALELIPIWLSYLQERSLIESADAANVIERLRPLCKDRIESCEQTLDDRTPVTNLKAAFGL
jgi:hypothetical protein